MRHTRRIVLFSILPLLAAILMSVPLVDTEALKSKGVGTNSYGAATAGIVCGDKLCSEYPGGRAEFEEIMGRTVTMTTDSPDAHKETAGDEPAHQTLRLARANVPVTIPMHAGYYDGETIHYIITDASDEKHGSVITEMQGWKVERAPVLAHAPESALSTTYFFTNGIAGDGVHGYQNQVFTSIPGQDGYSALTSHVHATWLDAAEARVLMTEDEIIEAAETGQLVLVDLPVVINMPHISWPGGQMATDDRDLHDGAPYGSSQVLEIDTEAMEVTFVAHRGWGPDGRTIYYIVTDATPAGPADMMGVTNAPSAASLIANPAAADLYQFKNGITGAGPMGFQPGIATSALGDEGYSPMWRIYLIEWQDPAKAALLETTGDVAAYRDAGLISIDIARPAGSDHIVNCPFIDPFQ